MNHKELQNKVIDTALGYVGMQEIKGNLGWTSESFESKMESVGWKPTHAWCAYFSELVWSEVYDAHGVSSELDDLFSGSATKTYRQFEGAGWNVGTVPVPGSVVIWRLVKGGKPSWKGHAGILIDFNDAYMTTVEGNTNADGSREGEVVAKKRRKYHFKVNNGLELVGFIYPPGIEPHVPFLDKGEGDEFREWVNNYRPQTAKQLDLDKRGSWFNSFITRAWEMLGDVYDDK
jgi:hypothetical protein